MSFESQRLASERDEARSRLRELELEVARLVVERDAAERALERMRSALRFYAAGSFDDGKRARDELMGG